MAGLSIQLIVGLGNPGREYETTRHNAGFWVMDELAVRHGGVFRHEPRFAADVARTRIADQDCWLVKPQDYMNNSGRVSAAVASFYKIEAAAMLVVHDELDLPPAELRLKFGGGAGGHNGLKNLIQHFGEGFWRLRVGIGHPGEREKVNPWLLNSTTRVERADLELAIPMAADIVPVLLEEGAERAMQQLHSQSAMGSG